MHGDGAQAGAKMGMGLQGSMRQPFQRKEERLFHSKIYIGRVSAITTRCNLASEPWYTPRAAPIPSVAAAIRTVNLSIF